MAEEEEKARLVWELDWIALRLAAYMKCHRYTLDELLSVGHFNWCSYAEAEKWFRGGKIRNDAGYKPTDRAVSIRPTLEYLERYVVPLAEDIPEEVLWRSLRWGIPEEGPGGV